MFTISLCMIVKDEELTLDRVLTCAQQFADEIIIVDTGSLDKSIDIAKKYTDKIFQFKWCEDFSKARNFSFDQATKDYIIWLDADDYIDSINIQKIISLKNSSTPADVYMFKYIMGETNFEFYRERLLKNNNGYKWAGFVHEAIAPSGKIEYVDIEIIHKKIKKNPPKRNLNLYNSALKRGIKLTPREMYYYSRELYYNGYYSKAITTLKKYFHMQDLYTPNFVGACLILAECYIAKNNFNMALDTMLKSIRRTTPNAETCCLIATIFEGLNDKNQAIFWYNIALITPITKDGFLQKDYLEYIPCMELCRLYYPINYEKSKNYYLRAKELKPHAPAVKYNAQFFQH